MARVSCKGELFELTEWQLHMYEKYKELAEEKADNNGSFDLESAEYTYLRELSKAQDH